MSTKRPSKATKQICRHAAIPAVRQEEKGRNMQAQRHYRLYESSEDKNQYQPVGVREDDSWCIPE